MVTVFDVLAEPNRRTILDLLLVKDRSVNELVESLPLTQPTVSKHLKVLRESGLVTARADAHRRIYQLQAAPLLEIDRWLAPYRQAWADRLDALAAHLDTMEDE